MTSTAGEPEAVVAVDDGALALTVSVGGDGIPRLTRFGLPGSASSTRPGSTLPLLDVLTPGTGRTWSGTRHTESALGSRRRYRGHSARPDGPWQEVLIDLADPATGLSAEICYRILAGHALLWPWTTLTNQGDGPFTSRK